MFLEISWLCVVAPSEFSLEFSSEFRSESE